MAPLMKSDDSKHRPPNMAEQKRAMDSGYAPSQASGCPPSLSSWSVFSGPVQCDVCNDPAVKRCLTCMASYCEVHVKDHHTSPDLDSHELQHLHQHSLCPQHYKELEFYCRTDQSAICSRCFLHKHNGHDVIEQTPEKTPSESFMKKDIPPPGQIKFVSVQSDSVSLRWSPPEGAPAHRSFKVTWTGGQKHCNFPVTGARLDMTGLTPGEKYHFTVATLSQDGRQSTPVQGAVYTVVPSPYNLKVAVNLNALKAKVTWTKPAGVCQENCLLEIINVGDQGDIRTVQSNSCQYTLTGLKLNTRYTINITTVVSNGRQSQQVSTTFSTEVPPPQNISMCSDTARVTWTKPAGVDHVTYLLEIIKGKKVIHTEQTDSCHYSATGLWPASEYIANVTTVLKGSRSKTASNTFNTGLSGHWKPLSWALQSLLSAMASWSFWLW
ncbi:fibronectin-like [Engraulis encrasicolus]|uniref:fibronectin-like n=1 Tax=Engraulis encrasicolus TaxID=184585 RepID=UPI002FD1A7E7